MLPASLGSSSWVDPAEAEAELLEKNREEAHEERVDQREGLGHAQEDRPLDAVRRDAAVQGVVEVLNLDGVVQGGGAVERRDELNGLLLGEALVEEAPAVQHLQELLDLRQLPHLLRAHTGVEDCAELLTVMLQLRIEVRVVDVVPCQNYVVASMIH